MFKKICDNGVIRPMTPAELAEFERLAEQMPKPEPTIEEQVAELKKALAERDALILELLTKNN